MMSVVTYISSLIMPLVVFCVVAYGLLEKVDIYGAFVEGAKEGLGTVLSILPTLIGLMCAVTVLRESGALEALSMALAPVAKFCGFPTEIVPLSLMKAVSSSGATGLLTDIFKTQGADSFVGRVASIMMSSTETIFYTMSVYFTAVSVMDTKYTLSGAIFANIAGIIGAFFVTILIFGR